MKKHSKSSTFFILLKKSFKDLKTNIRQFLSIIFIITIAVTLFVGLQANYKSLKERINYYYEQGNMSSYWLTYGLVTNEEETNITAKLNQNGIQVESDTRLIVNAKVEGSSVNLVISDTYPTINKPAGLYIDGTSKKDPYKKVNSNPLSDTDFFIINQNTFASDNLSTTKWEDRHKVNETEVSVSFAISSYKSTILDNVDKIIDRIKNDYSEYIPEGVDLDKIKEEINNYVDDYISKNPDVEIKTKYTNYMLHPENLTSDSNTTNVALMSRNRFIAAITPTLDNMTEKMDEIAKELSTYLGDEFYKKYEEYKSELKESFMVNNQLLLKVDDDKVEKTGNILNDYYNSKEESTSNINKLLYKTDLANLSSNLTVQNDVEQAYDLSLTFPLLFMLVAILIVITTISQLILKERGQIGTFKSLGLTTKEILTHYLITTISLGIIGTLLGFILGPIILPKVMDIKYLILYNITATTYTFPFIAALITLVGIISIIALITFLIIRKQLKVMPCELSKPVSPNIKFKASKKDIKRSKFISLKIAWRNIRVYFGKSIMVIVGVFGCTGLLVCGYGIDDTINYGINHDLTLYYNYDIMVTYQNYDNESKQSVLNSISDYVDNDKTYNICILPATYYKKGYEGSSFSGTSYILTKEIIDNEIFNINFPSNTVAISNTYASNLSLKVGDTLCINISDNVITKEISLIYENFSMKSIILHAEDEELLTNYAKENCLQTYINLKDDVSSEKIEELVTTIKSLPATSVVNCVSYNTTITTIESYVSAISLMTLAIKVFAILLAIVCLINLALLNYKERTREMATLKVLGFSNVEIARSLIYQILMLTVVGALLGLSIGFPMMYLVLSINQNNYVSFIYHIEPITYIIGVLLSIITSLVVNIVLSLFINKIQMVESLKSVE